MCLVISPAHSLRLLSIGQPSRPLADYIYHYMLSQANYNTYSYNPYTVAACINFISKPGKKMSLTMEQPELEMEHAAALEIVKESLKNKQMRLGMHQILKALMTKLPEYEDMLVRINLPKLISKKSEIYQHKPLVFV